YCDDLERLARTRRGRAHRRGAGTAVEHDETGRAPRANRAGARLGGPGLVPELAGPRLGFAGRSCLTRRSRALCGERRRIGQGTGRRQRSGRSHPGDEQWRLRRAARQAARRVAGAEVIALFPLNIVLFPDGPLPLRIFETRYVDMVRRCMRETQTFGVVLIREGSEVGPAETFDVGTLAKIVDFHQLSDGLLGLSCVGAQRFRIRSRSRQADGLNLGEVDYLAVEP